MSVLKTILKLAAPLPDITKYERYLFLGPHPDDIEIGAGATAAKLAATGNRGEEQKYKEGDGELQSVEANNTDSLLVFTNKLRMYAAKIKSASGRRPIRRLCWG